MVENKQKKLIEKREALITLVPAIHSGYLNFFKKHKGAELFIVGKDFLKDFPKLERDIRKGEDESIKKMIESLKIFKKVQVLDRKNIGIIFSDKKINYFKIIMPEDNILREISLKYLPKFKIKFENIFLRWAWKNATHIKHKISTSGTLTKDKFAKTIIKDLFEEAKKSSDWWRQIASALVIDGKVVKTTYNHHLPTDHNLDLYGDPRSNFDAGEHPDKYTSIHSEASMIAWAAKEGVSLNGATLYVTTFPCGNCSKLIAESGIKKIYFKEGYSVLDADNVLKKFGVKVYRVE
jgi:dCMP deaminase